MANPKSELRALALTAASAYRTKTVTVPEWNNTTVTLRNKRADVTLFVDVLGDESGHRVFSDEDRGVVEEIYGPVHARLLRQAIELGISQDDAEKK